MSAILAFAALTAVAGFGDDPRTAYALTNCSVTDLTFDSQEQEFLRLINEYRKSKGSAPLTASVNLNRAASWMSYDMATKNYFSHTDSLGRSSSTRMKNCDATVPGSGENIAAGTSRDTAQEVFDAWKASTGHNTNMLRSTYKQIGIARYHTSTSKYGWYWTTDFSTADDGTRLGSGGTSPTATPSPTPTKTASASPSPTSTPTLATKATMSSPAPGSTLAGTTVTFKWNAASNAQEYFLYVGTSAGSNNIYGKSAGLNLSASVSGLPSNGSTVYVRLWTKRGGTWSYNSYTYKAAP